MQWVSSAAQVRELDRRMIEDLGVPGVCLMETASRAVARAVVEHFSEAARRGVVVVCGGGNNGGDGYGCARWLRGWGLPVEVWSVSERSRGDAAAMRAACERMGVREVRDLREAALVVDAVLGTGMTLAPTGAAAQAIEAISAHSAPVLAVDLPSGLNADTGAVPGVVARATRTVTFGRLKPGLLAEPGADVAGEIEVADIGLGAAPDPGAVAEIPEPADLAPLWPRRRAVDHKNRSGHLLVMAGSTNLAGAAVLACRGALASGVGLVTLAVPRGALLRLGQLPPEVMVLASGAGDVLAPLPRAAFVNRTAVVAGPGLGGGMEDLHRDMRAWLEELWHTATMPVLFDADALGSASGAGEGPRVVTPHPGEAGRMLGTSASDVQRDRFGAARSLARDGRVVVLKGRHSLVAEEGRRTSVNVTGSPVLATGGSGDVLAGVIGALLARGVEPWDAARLGAWVHGEAGDGLARVRGNGWTASDVAAAIPTAVARLLDA